MSLHTYRKGQGPSLFLVHGWGMHAGLWQPLVDALCDRYELTCVDLPGHGHSPWLSHQSELTDWARAVAEVAPPDAVWLGWSLGGLIMREALFLGLVQSRAWISLASAPCFVRRADWPHAMPVARLQQFTAELRQDFDAGLYRFLALQVHASQQRKQVLRQLRQALRSAPAPCPQALEVGLQILRDSDLRTHRPAKPVPGLYVLGERDTLVPARLAGDLQALAEPKVRVHCIAGAAHAPFLSHLELLLPLLEEFLCHDEML